jgi:hypothetical protein
LSLYEGYCKSNDSGELFIYNINAFYEHFKLNPSKDFVFNVETISNKPKNKLVAYLYAEVIPKVIEGFRAIGENHNKISIVQELKKYCPVLWKYEMQDGNLLPIDRELDELNFFELKRLIDEISILAAEQLNIKIEEPK